MALAVAALSTSAAVVEIVKPVHLNNPPASAGIETAITALAVVAVGLLTFRFMHSRMRRDLLLMVAVALVSLKGFAFAVAPALAGVHGAVAGTSARLAMQVLAAIVFAAAALAPDKKVTDHIGRVVVLAGLAAIGTIVVAELVDLLTGAGPIVGTLRPSEVAAAADDPVALSAVVGSSGTLIVAGIVFASRARRREDNAGLLAAACFLLAAAWLQSVSMAAVAADWVTLHDGLRVSAYTMLLLVALRGYAQTRQEETQAVISADRERIARDLHDGLAQDLAIIAVHSQRLQSELGSEHALTLAARRALASSRGTIYDLSASDAPTTNAALCQVADELAARFGVHVDVNVEADAEQTPCSKLETHSREDVVRIAREAIVNAATHGGAHRIELALDRRGSALRLRVADDGCGIGVGVLQSDNGFGLSTMDARAKALGGRLTVREGPRGGTELEVFIR